MKVEKFNSTKAVKLIYDIPYNYTLIFGESRIKVFILTFVLSVCFSSITNVLTSSLNDVFLIIILLLVIGIGILFDIIGVSITAASPKVFHSMNSRRVSGANIAVKLIKNSEKVSSFCCDVIGDICGVISGATAISIATMLSKTFSFNLLITTLIVTGIISAMTIGGKAIGKSFAINKCDIIIYEFSKFISIFYRCKK